MRRVPRPPLVITSAALLSRSPPAGSSSALFVLSSPVVSDLVSCRLRRDLSFLLHSSTALLRSRARRRSALAEGAEPIGVNFVEIEGYFSSSC